MQVKTMSNKKNYTVCPNCDSLIEKKDTKKSYILVCSTCFESIEMCSLVEKDIEYLTCRIPECKFKLELCSAIKAMLLGLGHDENDVNKALHTFYRA